MKAHRLFRFGAGEIDIQSSAEWAAYARKVESLGYSTLWIGEHTSQRRIEPALGLLAVANATSTLRLASHVFTNDFHHPVILARVGATLDLLSEGRLEFGLGAGWMRSDYDVCGIPFDPPGVRIARLEEAIRVIKGLWGVEPVEFTGRYYWVKELDPQPKPKQRPHPPIFIGGGGRRVLTLAAREADIVGLDAQGTSSGNKNLGTTAAEVVAQQIDWIRTAAGLRFADLELQTLVWAVHITGDRRRGAEEVAARMASWPPTIISNPPNAEHILASPQFLVGTVEQIVADLEEYRESYGLSYFTVFGASVDDFGPVVARLAGT
jgi:probable F420-dependent oxidoreductase